MYLSGLFYFGFLVPHCTRKNNLAKKWQKNAQKIWMNSPKKLQIKKILDEVAKLWMKNKL